jgi:hypothetical protein
MSAGRDRAQTQQDFAVGVSVFLLGVFFVFTFVPTTIAPTGADTESSAYVSDRLAESVLEDISDPAEANTVDREALGQFFLTHNTTSELRANYSLERTTQANVTLETLEGTTVQAPTGNYSLTAGEEFPGGVGVSQARIVRVDDERFRLVVRVW